ncbi:COBRA-like protein 10 [Abeliophyllum distichum]|uniref:COBRA-like protein 10 n=1 Tax=Abeliophyllum distichum TaxID=126358 RepID=A0ABD1QJK6_9LAMI
MNETKARAIFLLEVFKLPPDMNRTALNPPQNWEIEGVLNPTYKCSPPFRVDPSEFPDPSGISATISTIASWHINKAFPGYENVYSFNGTKLPQLKNTILMQGLPGLNYLFAEVNGTC